MASPSDSDSESEDKAKVKKPTTSEIYFTSEERQTRKQYKVVKSEFCLNELWKLYNKLVVKYRTVHEAESESGDDFLVEDTMIDFGYIEDPTEEMRQSFLAKKYRYLLDGIAYLIHCCEKPYLLTQNSRELDCPGRRLALPKAIKATRPEVFAITAAPFEGTVSYTKQWMNVSNLNFEVVRARTNSYTQTEASDILKTDRIPARVQIDPLQDVSTSFLFLDSQEDMQVDLLDIPLDADGNPIGKRTGFCEWCSDLKLNKQTSMGIPVTRGKPNYCHILTVGKGGKVCCYGTTGMAVQQLIDDNSGYNDGIIYENYPQKQEILPIPTPFVLSKTWERAKLYCCQKYRELVEEVMEFDNQLRAEKFENELLIDVRHKMKPEKVSLLDPELAEQVIKKQLTKPRLSVLGKWVKEAIAKRRASLEGQWAREMNEMTTDTVDLPWDPYETRYSKLPPFKNQTFDESMEHVYRHAEIVLVQTEMYFSGPKFDDIGDLRSCTDND